MKAIAIISFVIVIIIIAVLIGLSIYYNVKITPTPIPTTIPELLGFKNQNTKKSSEKFISLHSPVTYSLIAFGVLIGSLIVIGVIGFFLGSYTFLPNWGPIYTSYS